MSDPLEFVKIQPIVKSLSQRSSIHMRWSSGNGAALS